MLLPYRTKNPPETFPYCTIGLIAVNVLVFLLTCDGSISIREDVVKSFATSHNTMYVEPWRIITALFLHQNIWHIGGNMLFLWLFGAATEGRLKPARFLAMYFVAGIAGDLLEDLIWGIASPSAASLGASGAIMGVAGAYLYLFPYSVICIFYWLGWFWRGVWECQARWVVTFYVGSDLLETVLFQGQDGVGHLAHIGGFGAGVLFTFLMRTRRDTKDVSEVQSVQADVQDYSLLSISDLQTLLSQPTENMDLVMAFLEKATANYSQVPPQQLLQLLHYYAGPLILRADPERLAFIVLRIPISEGGLHPAFYLRIGSRLEHQYSNDLAAQIYRRVYELSPTSPDTEMALFRLAVIMESAFGNKVQAHALYREMLRLFPNGELAHQAVRSLNQG